MCYWGEKYLSHEAPNSKYSTQDSQLMRWFIFEWNIHWKIMFRFAFACYATTISQWLTEPRIVHRLKMFEQQFYWSSEFPNREKKSHFFKCKWKHCVNIVHEWFQSLFRCEQIECSVLAVKDLDLVSSNIYCGLFPISARKSNRILIACGFREFFWMSKLKSHDVLALVFFHFVPGVKKLSLNITLYACLAFRIYVCCVWIVSGKSFNKPFSNYNNIKNNNKTTEQAFSRTKTTMTTIPQSTCRLFVLLSSIVILF